MQLAKCKHSVFLKSHIKVIFKPNRHLLKLGRENSQIFTNIGVDGRRAPSR